MTKLLKLVMRETRVIKSYRSVVVELRPPDLIGLRLKGTRKVLLLPVGAAYDTAARMEAQAIIKQRKEARKAKNLARRKGI